MKCRHCTQPLNLAMLDLGSAPPSNAYLSETSLHSSEIWYPLRVLVCQHCWLVQTEDYAGRESLFTHDYAYFSSFSSSWLAHARMFVECAQTRLGLNASTQVVEIAANDGYLLQYVSAAGIPCYGIEPTASTAAAARAKGLHIIERFFGVPLANELVESGRQADLIVANNVLAHVPDINDFVAGCARLLKTHGVATFEFPHLLRMVQGCQFDTAYHEHYSYLSLTAVKRIFHANGLVVIDVEQLPTHGGSLRVWAALADVPVSLNFHGKGIQRVQELLAEEKVSGIQGSDFYSDFQSEALRVKHEFLAFLLQCQMQGKRVAGYGAAAKGNTLLNFAGVRPDLLPWVVDANPAKQGHFLPGSRIPIVDEQRLRCERPDYILVLPWNLRDEVAKQLSYVREWGGKLVVAVPNLEVLP
jgi:SAM-dependent methyltransferase